MLYKTKLASDSNLLRELSALGKLSSAQGDLRRAEQHFRLALSLYESSFPENHIEAMVCLLGLVRVLERQNRHDEVRLAQEKIQQLNIRRRTPEHGPSFGI